MPLQHIRPLDEKALEVLQPALAIWQELKDKKNEGETLDNIGGVYFWQDKYDKALEILQQALAIRREVGDIKDFNKAIALSQQALTIARQIQAPKLEAEALENLSDAYNKQGNQQKALEYANQVLEIAKRKEDSVLKLSVLNN